MDGTQTPGVNFNSIDGLTTVNATSIIINGSTINLDSYIPYVGAVSNPDFNTKILRNIGNAVNPQDAVAFSQLGTYVPYTGATSNVDLNTRLLRNIGDGVSNNDAISLQQLNAKRYDTIENGAGSVYVNCGLSNLTLQATAAGRIDIGTRARIWPTDTDAIDTFEVRNFSGASKFYVDTTASNRSQFTTALTVITSANTTSAFDVKDSALTSLFTINTTTPTINCLTTTSMNSNKITNLANGTASADAVNFGQLTAFRPSSIINGTTSVVCDGTNVINNIGNSSWIHSDSALTLFDSASVRYFTIGWPSLSNDLSFSNVAGTGKFIFNGEVDVNSNKITNLANGTLSGDAVNFGQLSTISSLITPLPAATVQGSYVVYDGTSYVNNYNVVYLGNSPGKTGIDSINIGNLAGSGSSAGLRIAIGSLSGFTSQATYCIAIGATAGNSGQLESAIAIGTGAGELNQGKYAIAIGNSAGISNQHPSSIIINATGAALNSAVSTATYIAPLRITTSENTSSIRNKVAQYDTLTKELRYSGTTIFNVIVIGAGAVAPTVSFMPTGFPIDLFGFTFTCTVVRNAIGDYTLTFPASCGPNLLTATITTGVNALITAAVGGSKIVTAIATASDTIRINYVFANVAFTDLAIGEYISLRIEFNTL